MGNWRDGRSTAIWICERLFVLNLSDLSVGCSEASDHNWPQLHTIYKILYCMYKLLYRQIESSLGNWGLGAPRGPQGPPRGPKGLGWDPITSLASFGLGVAAARVAQEVWVLSHSGWRFRMDIEWYWKWYWTWYWVILILKILNSMLFKILGKWSFVKR